MIDSAPSKRPLVFVSASVPRSLNYTDAPHYFGVDTSRWKRCLEANHAFADSARPDLIYDAVARLTQETVRRGWGIVFGGHPTITPMMIAAAKHLGLGTVDVPWIHLHQSRYFPESQRPKAVGWFEDTGIAELHESPRGTNRADSLTRLREDMASHPSLVAAFFVGGMRGLFEEAAILRWKRKDVPMFAFGATGGAAQGLLDGTTRYEDHVFDSAVLGDLQADTTVRPWFTRVPDDALAGWTNRGGVVDPPLRTLLRSSTSFLRLATRALDHAETVRGLSSP